MLPATGTKGDRLEVGAAAEMRPDRLRLHPTEQLQERLWMLEGGILRDQQAVNATPDPRESESQEGPQRELD